MIGVRGGETYTQMGGAAIRHILEVGKDAGPDNAVGYQIGSFFEIDQMRVAIEITVEKGKGGYEDKNRVRYLSQNPSSDTFKSYQRLAKGDTEPTTAPATAPPPSVTH